MLCSPIVKSLPAKEILYDMFHKFLTESLLWDIIILTIYLHDSRPTDDSSIRRRRQCDECGKRFTTYEKIETLPLIVVKKDNNREPYDREKIIAGIVRSCHKRPVSMAQVNEMVDDIESQIFNMGEKEVPTTTIGAIVMDKLKNVDEVAYVRFASVYREFKDVNTFMDEIKKILNN